MPPLPYPYWPAQPYPPVPAPGPPGPSQQREDELEALRSRDEGDIRASGAGTLEVFIDSRPGDGPGLRPPGINTRAARFPEGGPILDQHPGNGQIIPAAGLAAVLANTAHMPDGHQLPVGIQPKTWRATPTPWDEGIYAGFVQPTDSSLGDP